MSLEARVGVFIIVSLVILGATAYFVRPTQKVRGQVVYTTSLRYAGDMARGTPVLCGHACGTRRLGAARVFAHGVR